MIFTNEVYEQNTSKFIKKLYYFEEHWQPSIISLKGGKEIYLQLFIRNIDMILFNIVFNFKCICSESHGTDSKFHALIVPFTEVPTLFDDYFRNSYDNNYKQVLDGSNGSSNSIGSNCSVDGSKTIKSGSRVVDSNNIKNTNTSYSTNSGNNITNAEAISTAINNNNNNINNANNIEDDRSVSPSTSSIITVNVEECSLRTYNATQEMFKNVQNYDKNLFKKFENKVLNNELFLASELEDLNISRTQFRTQREKLFSPHKCKTTNNSRNDEKLDIGEKFTEDENKYSYSFQDYINNIRNVQSPVRKDKLRIDDQVSKSLDLNDPTASNKHGSSDAKNSRRNSRSNDNSKRETLRKSRRNSKSLEHKFVPLEADINNDKKTFRPGLSYKNYNLDPIGPSMPEFLSPKVLNTIRCDDSVFIERLGKMVDILTYDNPKFTDLFKKYLVYIPHMLMYLNKSCKNFENFASMYIEVLKFYKDESFYCNPTFLKHLIRFSYFSLYNDYLINVIIPNTEVIMFNKDKFNIISRFVRLIQQERQYKLLGVLFSLINKREDIFESQPYKDNKLNKQLCDNFIGIYSILRKMDDASYLNDCLNILKAIIPFIYKNDNKKSYVDIFVDSVSQSMYSFLKINQSFIIDDEKEYNLIVYQIESVNDLKDYHDISTIKKNKTSINNMNNDGNKHNNGSNIKNDIISSNAVSNITNDTIITNDNSDSTHNTNNINNVIMKLDDFMKITSFDEIFEKNIIIDPTCLFNESMLKKRKRQIIRFNAKEKYEYKKFTPTGNFKKKAAKTYVVFPYKTLLIIKLLEKFSRYDKSFFSSYKKLTVILSKLLDLFFQENNTAFFHITLTNIISHSLKIDICENPIFICKLINKIIMGLSYHGNNFLSQQFTKNPKRTSLQAHCIELFKEVSEYVNQLELRIKCLEHKVENKTCDMVSCMYQSNLKNNCKRNFKGQVIKKNESSPDTPSTTNLDSRNKTNVFGTSSIFNNLNNLLSISSTNMLSTKDASTKNKFKNVAKDIRYISDKKYLNSNSNSIAEDEAMSENKKLLNVCMKMHRYILSLLECEEFVSARAFYDRELRKNGYSMNMKYTDELNNEISDYHIRYFLYKFVRNFKGFPFLD
ncbi:hypothetical protein EDEG_05094 [Edhazardia aedis USNM 41457]|uniref:Uncharacterized protein n=1 Tax=Edhazardia aedis (strain USNM 41457) TaxID=1003232 RepID=A0A0L1P638_EDHAE|nr:hypothetical protein EDEG_05094 [Edhazardia aedis USNM 41457]|eukprot:KNH48523.1 hypothetical protein EDEG_05094 [Edhazardia aedis USNM 41457]